ncbi:MAG: OmpH family outer membrane protein [Saprospiraceae bacterium]|nr:OmpH family outer membrane protein [Saprospiraceae bacterium]
MKKLFQTFDLFFICFLFCATYAPCIYAQDKIAYINVEEVIQNMPDYKNVQVDLEIYQKQLVKQLEQEKKSIANFYKTIIDKVKLGAMSPKEQQDAEKELQKKQTILKEKTDDVNNRLQFREKELTKPIYKKFELALKKVAKANAYTYILDKKLLVYSLGGIDATDKIKTALE